MSGLLSIIGKWTLVFAFLVVLANTRGHADQVIITEVLQAPSQGGDSWVEVSNLTATPFDIAEWRLKGKKFTYHFPAFSKTDPDRSFLRPFERIILTESEPDSFRERLNLDDVRVFGPWEGEIGAERDDLKLLDKNGIALCSLPYDQRAGWPLESIGTGHSMVVVDEDQEIADPGNWRPSSVIGGTPGRDTIPPEGVPLSFPTTYGYESTPIFDYHTLWKFDASGRELNPSWRKREYDDSGWADGSGLLGFEDSNLPETGLETKLPSGRVAYYFRKSFSYSGPIDGVRLSIDQIVDDGAVYYLNGKRIGRVRMRSGLPAQNTFSTETVKDAIEESEVISFGGELLREGGNVLAVQVHQGTRGSSDLVFGCRLNLLRPVAGPFRITRVALDSDGGGFVDLLNFLEDGQEFQGLVVRLIGDETIERAINQEVIIEVGEEVRIAFSALEIPSGKLRKVELLQSSTGQLFESVPIAIPSSGLVQERDSELSDQWSLKRFLGERGDEFLPRPGDGRLFVSEIVLGAEASESWVELANRGDVAISAGAVGLSAKPGSDIQIYVDEQIAPRSNYKMSLGSSFSLGRHRVYLTNQMGETLESHEFDVSDGKKHFSRFPIDGRDWYTGEPFTPGAPNESPRIPSIVINEIMADPAFGNESGEFVELHNFGSSEVDLTGASFTEGIRYQFPAGSILSPGQYLVLGKDRTWIESVVPDLTLHHLYQGSLSNRGERLRLVDGLGNLIDEVHYKLEGDWPRLAAGRGSSLELTHPSLDNGQSSAWADSRESRKSSFERYEFRGRYQEVARMGQVSDFRELHFYLVGESHIVLRNIELRDAKGSGNILSTVPSLSEDGGDWLIQGNHADSFVEGDRLHLIAHGHGDNRANRAEVDVVTMEEGKEYILSFDARWVSGSPRLVVHTWDNSFAHSFSIKVPRDLGTPGRQNSQFRKNSSPQLNRLDFSPAVPSPGQPVVVTVRGSGRIGERVELVYREAEVGSSKGWGVISMRLNSNGAGEPLSDGLFSGVLAGDWQRGQVIEFFVRASTQEGLSSYLPRLGERKPAMVVFDERRLPSDLRTIRLVVHPRDLELMQGWGTGHTQKYPRLSNQYFNATFVSNEKKVVYGGELRRSGSPWTRNGGLSRGKWKLPKDREFRNHGKFSFDDDPDKWTRHHNRFARYLLYLLGHPVSENEFVRVIVNGDQVMIREDVEPVDTDFIQRNFSKGNDGELYRIDDQWWFSDHWQQSHRDATWDYLNSDQATWYRNSWMKRSREEEDDYSNLIHLFKLVSTGNYSDAEIKLWLDADQIMKMTAVMGYVGDWDTFTQRRGKNAYLYRRSEDGRFQFLQWDTDLAFQHNRGRFYGGRRSFVQYVERPDNLSRLRMALSQLDDYCLKNPERVHAWIKAETEAHPDTRINAQMYLDWFAGQERHVDRFLGRSE
ncbi:lamin tail domain-containing protein [Verrucomicrobia bacterium]|nr:lamin tail domain-containing protein [Verrucomicrobiota bacterium]